MVLQREQLYFSSAISSVCVETGVEGANNIVPYNIEGTIQVYGDYASPDSGTYRHIDI